MPRPLAEDPFELHAWAIAGLLDACEGLSAEQLAFGAPGAFGTVMDTLRHLVEGDRFQLWAAGAGAVSASGEALRLAIAVNPRSGSKDAFQVVLPRTPDHDELRRGLQRQKEACAFSPEWGGIKQPGATPQVGSASAREAPNGAK